MGSMYTDTATGLSPDQVEIQREHHNTREVLRPMDARYLLRPETVESLWVLHQVTGNEKYREQAWTIFEAIEQHAKVKNGGYGAHRVGTDARKDNNLIEDVMESFFLAETLKYLYLIFDESNPVNLKEVVLNTEAHPIPITPDSPFFTPLQFGTHRRVAHTPVRAVGQPHPQHAAQHRPQP